MSRSNFTLGNPRGESRRTVRLALSLTAACALVFLVAIAGAAVASGALAANGNDKRTAPSAGRSRAILHAHRAGAGQTVDAAFPALARSAAPSDALPPSATAGNPATSPFQSGQSRLIGSVPGGQAWLAPATNGGVCLIVSSTNSLAAPQSAGACTDASDASSAGVGLTPSPPASLFCQWAQAPSPSSIQRVQRAHWHRTATASSRSRAPTRARRTPVLTDARTHFPHRQPQPRQHRPATRGPRREKRLALALHDVSYSPRVLHESAPPLLRPRQAGSIERALRAIAPIGCAQTARAL